MTEQLLQQIMEKLTALQSDVTSIKSAQNQQGDMLTQLISIIASTNQKVVGLESTLDQIDARTRRIESGQARQEHALSSLALRSIEQENKIRDLQRAR